MAQALEVLGEEEGLAAHGPQQVEHRVAAQQADVERGDRDLLGGEDASVEEDVGGGHGWVRTHFRSVS